MFNLGKITATFRKNLNSKKFKYGGYATLLTAVVIAALVIINVLVGRIGFMVDLTRNQLFTLSDQTFQVIDQLDEEIDVIFLSQPGTENQVAMQIVDRYVRRNPRLRVSTIDPVRNPHMVMRFQGDGTRSLANGTIVVENRENNRFKLIAPHELINHRMDRQQQPVAESLAVEQRVTGAIIYVTTEELPVIYTLSGHDQSPIPIELRRQLEIENFRIEEINLMTTETVPEDAHALLVISPKRDLAEVEEQRLRSFLENQGRAIFLMDLLTQSLPKFEALFQSYGVTLNQQIVVEGDAAMHVGNPIWLVPNLESHDIISPLRASDMRMLLPVSQSLSLMDVRRRTLDIQPLLRTSDTAWAKTNLQTQTLEREEGDLPGPFDLAVAITDNVFDGTNTNVTKILLVANAGFLSDEISNQVPGNINFILNGINWIQDREEAISIRPRTLGTPRLTMNWQQQLLIAGIAVVLIPLLILGSGLFVWLRRRHL